MECMDVLKIEKHLNNGDPYTFALLMVDGAELPVKRQSYPDTEQMMKYFGELAKKKFSSATVLFPFEGDIYVAFAPFVLDRNHMMKVFDALQQEYYEFAQKQCSQKEHSVFIGCVTGTKQTTLEELCQKAEKLVRALRNQGRHGYKIMEEE